MHRRQLLVLGAASVSTACSGLNARGSPAMTDEERALRRRFRGLSGGELFVDAITPKRCVVIFNESGGVVYTRGSVSIKNNRRYSYSSEFGVPRTLRVTWREGDCRVTERYGEYVGGTIIGDYTVPVAERIPDELLDDLRRNGGMFRLKIRIHDDGPLIGWDIKDILPTYHAGGDFREADIVNGKVVRKGWYIDPKTKQKIETDF
jgi:hypothetical protein